MKSSSLAIRLIVGLIFLVTQLSCSLFEKSRIDRPPIHMILADDTSHFNANTFLIEGKNELMLIDSQRTVSEAKKIIKKIYHINKPLTLIFITSAKADHYLGSRVIRQAFPGARYVTTPNIYKELKKNGRKLWAANARLLESEGRPQESVRGPLSLEQEKGHLTFEDMMFELIEFTLGDGQPVTAVFNKQWKILFASDLITNGHHLHLPQNSTNRWVENLKELKNLPVEHIYPGHGELGDRTLIDKNLAYLEKYQEGIDQGLTNDQLEIQLNKQFPTYLPAHQDIFLP